MYTKDAVKTTKEGNKEDVYIHFTIVFLSIFVRWIPALVKSAEEKKSMVRGLLVRPLFVAMIRSFEGSLSMV